MILSLHLTRYFIKLVLENILEVILNIFNHLLCYIFLNYYSLFIFMTIYLVDFYHTYDNK